jgi:acetylornithine deacetylase/succinyl-diaminopimelate desuccinylase-like protein
VAVEADRHLARLVELTSFASVGADPAGAAEMERCAASVEDLLRAVGLDRVRQVPTGGHPVVVGERLDRPGAPTVLVYGHYDVQPAEPLEAWTSPPFTPTVRDGRLYARGVSDNKGQIVAALAAIEELIATTGALPCNVRVLVEGEEETRSDNLEALLIEHRTAPFLQADLALVTDSGILAEDAPGIPIGLRGMIHTEITLRTAARDLHSGLYGGIAPNAALELARLLAGLKEETSQRVLVDGFYEGIASVGTDELAGWARLGFDPDAAAREIGAVTLVGEQGLGWHERMWAWPTLDVCGLWSGYTGEGVKTVIPAEAHAKISCRVVPFQDPASVLEALTRHLVERAPAYAEVTVDSTLVGAAGVLLPADHPGVRAALAALRATWPVEPALFRAGYSVPVVDLLARHVGLDSVMLGFMLPDENMHAPDEFIRLDVFRRAIATYAAFFRELGEPGAAGGAR